MPRFGPRFQPHVATKLTKTTVTATWMHNGDTSVQAYWLGWHADAGTPEQRRTPIQWQKVTPPTGCTSVTSTLPKLTSGYYRLWMEMDVSTPELADTPVSRVGLSETSFEIP
jgi:hypothetical protein